MVARLAGAALNFARNLSSRSDYLSFSEVQDFNWVVGKTVEGLTGHLGGASRRSYLSETELAEIQVRLERFRRLAPISTEEHRRRISEQIGEIRAISNTGFIASVIKKIETLLESVERPSGEATAAAATALHYLAEKHDVVHDSLGFLGLLDDIYVIEWAYSFIEGHTNWLPILDDFLEKWPFVDDMLFGDDNSLWKLDRWCRYVVCAGLSTLLDDNRENNLLIMREVGPFGLFIAFFVALEIQRERSTEITERSLSFEIGQPLLLGDLDEPFKVNFGGVCDYAGVGHYWLLVKDNGKISVSEQILTLARSSPTEHIPRQLSPGNDVSEWFKKGHAHPLTHSAGRHLPQGTKHQGVLLITQKKRMDEFLPHIKPRGLTVPVYFGMRYMTSKGTTIDQGNSATDHPFIYACSDVARAFELIRKPPEHISGWTVISDGAAPGRKLSAMLRTSGQVPDIRFSVLADLHDREICGDLIKSGFDPWYLQDLDVEIPQVNADRGTRAHDKLDRFIARQQIHWITVRKVHSVESPFHEKLFEIYRDICDQLQQSVSQNSDLQILCMMVKTFVDRTMEYPLDPKDERRDQIRKLASRIYGYSSTLRAFQEHAGRLFEHFSIVSRGDPPVCSKETHLKELIAQAHRRGETEIAVLCRSNRIAEKCREAASKDPTLSSVSWVNLDGLRDIASVDRVIVPGWIDRITMRDLANNGYAGFIDFIFLRYEEEMFQSAVSAGFRWETRLSNNNTTRYEFHRRRARSAARDKRSLWGQIKNTFPNDEVPGQNRADVSEPIKELAEDFEFFDSQIVDAIKNMAVRTGSRDEPVDATLVLFEETGSFAYLPPAGNVIALSDAADDAGSTSDPSEESAERILYRKVSDLSPGLILAFPVDGDRDLVDARADQFLEEAEQTRQLASLWKQALSDHFRRKLQTYSEFAKQMEELGESRHPATVRSWTQGASTVLPIHPERTIAIIGKITENEDLRRNMKVVLEAGHRIYNARKLAAKAIVDDIFLGEIDLNDDRLEVEIGGSVVMYDLQRISSIYGTIKVDTDLVGRTLKLGEAEPNLFSVGDVQK